MLRGVWGLALHGLDEQAYQAVFEGTGPPHDRTPAYILRPGPPAEKGTAAADWILVGDVGHYQRVLIRAWDVASGLGLGPDRTRFIIRRFCVLDSTGGVAGEAFEQPGWSLASAAWPVPGVPAETPCRLRFLGPVRLIRKHRLVEQPSLPDLVLGACRRVEAYLNDSEKAEIELLRPKMLEIASQVRASPWRGDRLDFVRYSGRQKREVELHGVTGCLDLPEGPGELWPLLSALQWIQVGKGTALGLGQLVVEPLGS